MAGEVVNIDDLKINIHQYNLKNYVPKTATNHIKTVICNYTNDQIDVFILKY